MNDIFQAKETYKSIVENFEKGPNDPEDIREIASIKLDALNASESKKSTKPEEQKKTEGENESDEPGE